jgi:hypothetical protein
MGNWLAKNPAIVGLVTVLLIVVAGAMAYRTFAGGRNYATGREVWFYDLQSGELFGGAPNAHPPIAAPSDRDATDGARHGVRAFVYACGSCDVAENRSIVYVERYTAALSTALGKLTVSDAADIPLNSRQAMNLTDAQVASGRELAVPQPGTEWQEWKWSTAATPEGIRLLNAPPPACEGGPAVLCAFAN